MPKLINRFGVAVPSTAALEQTFTLTVDAVVEEIAAQLAGFKTIEITFSHFTDGRGYSSAKILRDRYSFRGELRAVGDITVDQLVYLARCGFDSFALRDDQELADAKTALSAFSAAYQATHPLPGLEPSPSLPKLTASV
jgi:uncharacterized protein (DUF934 family)